MKRVFSQLSAAAIAVGLLYVVTPFMPTSLLIEPISLTMTDDNLQYVRKVRVQLTGKHQTEVTQGREIFPQCNAYGKAVFEKRPNLEPVEWHLPCDLPDGEYKVEVCVTAEWFGVDMLPACISSLWTVGKPLGLSGQVERLKQQLDLLQIEVQRK